MWHELVLHGIGGRTIAEAKERLTYDEFLSWVAYIQKRGTLHWGMRLEVGFGQALALISRGLGGKAEPIDYMPHLKADEAEREATPEDVMRMFGVRR